MGMATGSGGDKRPAPSVNVTPLVDVALVVLIIFMMATVATVRSFFLNIPKKPEVEAPPASDAPPPLVMTVAPTGALFINQKPIARTDLPARLPRLLAAQPRQVLFFDAQDGTSYGTAVEAMDLARAAGARSIAIITEPVDR